MGRPPPFFSGVIEGFYGRPWTHAQRLTLFGWMRDAGLDTYGYAPKDDRRHRAWWRSAYEPAEAADLKALIEACHAHGLRFLCALGPGLDLRYACPDDRARIVDRFRQWLELGADDCALLFDDIPDRMHPEDRERFGTFAAAHADVANAVHGELRAGSPGMGFLLCPTPYCSRMDRAELGGAGYLDGLGEALDPAIGVLWTGPEIISARIDEDHCAEIAARLRRRPVIWDNLQANDYDLRRLFLGPCRHRPPDPRGSTGGILINPNCEFEANFIPVRTLGDYVRQGPAYDPDASLAAAIDAWLPAFGGCGRPWRRDEVALLADVFHLPHEDGPAAARILTDAIRVTSTPRDRWGGAEARLRQASRVVEGIATRLTELDNRELFHAFTRQWWELREELDLLVRYLDRCGTGPAEAGFRPPDHHPGTFRGGVVARLQRCLDMDDRGFVRPSGP